MRKINLITSALLAVCLSVWVLSHPGWLWAKKSNHILGRRSEVRATDKDPDWLASDTGRRWRNCEPNHWRGYMLQH